MIYYATWWELGRLNGELFIIENNIKAGDIVEITDTYSKPSKPYMYIYEGAWKRIKFNSIVDARENVAKLPLAIFGHTCLIKWPSNRTSIYKAEQFNSNILWIAKGNSLKDFKGLREKF